MGLSAGPAKHRAEGYGNRSRDARGRKALIMVISGGMATVVIGAIAAGLAMLDFEPAQQHVELEISPRTP